MDCCAVPLPDEEKVNKVIAWVVKKDSVSEDAAREEILAICRDTLATQFIPDEVFFAEQLPLTAVGKIDFRTLEEMAKGKIQNA